MRVFLGGTCNESKWRDHIISMLEIDYFNPVVDDWNESAQQQELEERKTCDFCLYAITPKMTGVYAIAEVVDDSNKRPGKTMFVVLENDERDKFTYSQWKSLKSVAQMIERNGGQVFDDLKSAANWMNKVG